jgi:hypothetical protein
VFIGNGFPQMFQPWGYSYAAPAVSYVPANPVFNWGVSSFGAPAFYNPYNPYSQLGTPLDGLRGAGRAALGGLKLLPGIGALANGVDFVRDLGQMGRALKGDPTQSVFKKGADLLFHGLGVLMPQIGASYDIAQGTARQSAAFGLPAFNFNYGGYPSYYQGWMY